MPVRVLPSLGQVRRYAGDEADKPVTAAAASEFYALDTGKEYIWNGDIWVQKKDLEFQLGDMQAALDLQTTLLKQIAGSLEALLQQTLQ